MTEATAKKRNRIIDRSYDDVNGIVTLTVGDEVIAMVKVADVNPALLVNLAIRKIGDVAANAYTAALNAEGGTHEKAVEATGELDTEFRDGTLTLRSGAGEGMGIEEEKELVAQAIVSIPDYGFDIDGARAKVEELYALTEPRKMKLKDGTEKAYDYHAAYIQIKRDPDIAAYVAKQSKGDKSAKTKALLGVGTK